MLNELTAGEYRCGPLIVRAFVEDIALREKVAEILALYNVRWPRSEGSVDFHISQTPLGSPIAAGAFLRCGRMLVDRHESILYACTPSGSTALGPFHHRAAAWSINVPVGDLSLDHLTDIEDLIGLGLTQGWHACGWVPMHAAAVVRNGKALLLCATSGGGKSTLSAALVRRGWRALGDDKLLLRSDRGLTDLRALVHTFNLHPQTQQWFPEIGDVHRFLAYSTRTEKRRVPIAQVWQDAVVSAAEPALVGQLDRKDSLQGVRVTPLESHEILPTLLRQTVIPSDRGIGSTVLNTLAACAMRLRGFRIEIGRDAYRTADCLDYLEQALK
jgi:hypothetical protein